MLDHMVQITVHGKNKRGETAQPYGYMSMQKCKFQEN